MSNDKPISITKPVTRESDIQFKGMSNDESLTYQVEQWVKGNPLHNPIRDECCPDFSCCNGGKMMPEEVRKQFQQANNSGDERTVFSILGMALSGLAASEGVNLHIAGDNSIDN